MTTQSTHTIVMTGASRGIGAIAARDLLAHDPRAHLVVIGREYEHTSDRTTLVRADLSSVAATTAAATTVAASVTAGDLPPIVGFVGNAGIQYTDALTSTPDGLEATFAVNVVSNHVLIRELSRHMAAPSRIVITVSDTHFGDLSHNLGLVPAPVWQAPDVLARVGAFSKPDSAAAGRTAYSTSKLAAVHLVHAWSRMLPGGVDVVSFNPGFVPGTGLTRHAGRGVQLLMRAVGPALTLTPLATTSERAGAALADAVSGRTKAANGDYVDLTRVVPSSDESYDSARETELVEFLDTLR